MTRGGARALGVGLLIAAAAGCSMLRSDPTRFFLLTPMAAPVAAPGSTASRDVAVGIGPVRLPAYLDRSQVVTRTGGGEVQVSDLDQWAEPLADGVARVVAENLAALLGTDRVAVLPWRGLRAVQYQVALDLSRFDGAMGGTVALRGRWRLLDGRGRELALRTIDLSERALGRDNAAVVAALSRLLGEASREVADEIAERVASAGQPGAASP